MPVGGGFPHLIPSGMKKVMLVFGTRPEALDAGTVKLVGTDHDFIVSEVSKLLEDKAYYDKMSHAVNPYGDGKACGRIVEALK